MPSSHPAWYKLTILLDIEAIHYSFPTDKNDLTGNEILPEAKREKKACPNTTITTNLMNGWV